MTRPTATLGPGRRQLHTALLLEVTAHKATTPCLVRPRGIDWLDPRQDQQTTAATLCADCPAFQACRSYISGHPHEPGVWAGTTEADREARAATMRAVAAERRAAR